MRKKESELFYSKMAEALRHRVVEEILLKATDFMCGFPGDSLWLEEIGAG